MVKILENKRNIERTQDGKYIFTHTLVQEYEQSNINALVEAKRIEKKYGTEAIQLYNEKIKDAKIDVEKRLEEDLENKKKELEINKDTKVFEENAINYYKARLTKIEEFVKNHKKNVKEAVEKIEKQLVAEKLKFKDDLKNAKDTLKEWEQYYIEVDKK